MNLPNWWEDEGRRIGAALDGVSSAVVIGDDPVAASYVALGAAKVQSVRRQVTLADLVGDIGPLVSLVSGDDPHGIVDSFIYGVSINKIARPVEGNENLVILPSGTEPVAQQEVLGSERWRRLTKGYKEMNALLLAVAEPGAPALDTLVGAMEGVIMVGDAAARDGWRVFGTARAQRITRSSTPAVRTAPGQRPEKRPTAATARKVILGVGTAVLAAVVTLWMLRSGTPPVQEPAAAATVPADSAPAAAPGGDSLATDSLAADSIPVGSPPPEALAASPSTPGGTLLRLEASDSIRVVPYSVLVVAANTEESAMLRLQANQGRLPQGTFSPVVKGASGAVWYEVIVGAYQDRRRAQELLNSMRATRALGDSGGYVVRVPYTLLVRDAVTPDSAQALVAGYTSVGLPVYAMRQADGRMRLYAGAFEAPDQADRLARSLRVAGLEPAVVYRIGRPF